LPFSGSPATGAIVGVLAGVGVGVGVGVGSSVGVGLSVGWAMCALEADDEGLRNGERLSSALGDGPRLAVALAGPAETMIWVDSALGGAECGGAEELDSGLLA
jgi:hypothetical protein